MSADVGGGNKACSGCGIAEGGDVKLKDCSACKLVKYCGIECQRKHRSQHKKDCKRRAAELRDELLFKQPESSHLGDCPICCLPLSLDKQKSVLMGCCLKMICNGCDYANPMDVVGVKICQKCPFCRLPTAKSQEELESNLMKRVEANDPVAMYQMAGYRYQEKKFSGAIEYYTKAAGLGHAEAHYELSCLYHDGGKGVEQDKKRCLYHAEEAAIGGHPIARYNLASNEIEHWRFERAAKHWIIGAKLGHDNSLDGVKTSFKTGFVSKEEFAAALRAHQTAVDATKSPQRDEAIEARQNMHNLDAYPELRDRMMRSTFNRMSPDARRRARQNVRDGTFRMNYDI